ncbi:ImuA family protein [Paracoccus litorisediminis]|uniref:Protein ImuA n=1 Tax=Paracoccus litorisediminis TaxID=2006130 RepID=A0A844HRF6_9RHOB|nr:hypothetical protein [Paracoccus litorisediminis]MTH61739.1 hypothetical protein [Paracoccus litorisediminis]
MPHENRQAADPLALAPARVHEAEGQGRSSFALFQALRHPGPIFWVLPQREPHRPLPDGLPPGVAERLHLIETRTETDLLWAIEEALRSPASGFVIGEPGKALNLTAGRRLQLAAEAGRTTGLLLIREGHGCNAAETRWHCEPVAGPADSTRHRWRLKKNKSGTFGMWAVHWDGASAVCDLVSEAGE